MSVISLVTTSLHISTLHFIPRIQHGHDDDGDRLKKINHFSVMKIRIGVDRTHGYNSIYNTLF